MTTAWAVVAAALGASFLTFFGTWILEWYRGVREKRVAKQDRLRDACTQMTNHALSLSLRVSTTYRMMISRSGIWENFDQLVGIRKPIDLMDLLEWYRQDLQPMFEAQGIVEVEGDMELIKAAASLIAAASELIGTPEVAHTPRSESSAAVRFFRAWWLNVRGFRFEEEIDRRINESVKSLGREMRNFAGLTRKRLGVGDPDVLVDAFPGLFAARVETPD